MIFQVENQAGQNSILLKWGHVNGTVIDYTLQRKTGATGTFAELEISTTILLADMTGTPNHVYRIRARNAAGFGLWSEETPVDSTGIDSLSEPRGLTAVRQSGGAVLTWMAPVDSGRVVYQYQVLRQTGTAAFEEIGSPLSADVEVPSYIDTTLEASLTYTYKIRAFAPAGSSPTLENVAAISTESAEVILPLLSPVITTSVPTLTATASRPITDITIDTSGGGAVDSYSIDPAITMTPGLEFDTNSGTISGTPTTVADAVTYTITATNDDGTNTATVAITVIPLAPPGKVVIFQVENQAGQNSILLKWGHVSGTVIDYTLQRKTGATGTFAELEISTTILLADMTGTPNHVYRIRARNDDGFGPWSEETPVDSTGIDVLTEPRGLMAVRQSGGARLTWMAPVDSGRVVYQYQVQRQTGTAAFEEIGSPLSADVVTPSYTDTTLEASLTYTYKIRAFAPAGFSPTGENVAAISTESAEVILIDPSASPPVITASDPTLTATVGTAITAITIDASGGGAVDSYSIAPDLPSGLAFDTGSGTISGMPTAAAGAVEYTITATNDAGSDTTTVAITVHPAAPIISASVPTLTTAVGTAITPVTIDSTGGAVATYSIAPAIAMTPGLAFDADSGTISGMPTVAAAAVTYTITATNAADSDTATVAITVTAAPTLSDFAATATILEVVLTWEVSNGGSDITGYTLTRALGGITVPITPPPAIDVTTITDTIPAVGDYTYSLIATNDIGPSTAATVTVTATNAAPTADAGDAQTVAEGDTVTLDGSASSDPESETLTYTWTQTAPATGERGSGITLSGANTAAPTFTVPIELVDDTTLIFSLIVTDASSLVSTTADSVSVNVIGTNDPPIANAGSDQIVAEGAPVTLDGSASSDPENQTLTYVWEQTSPTTGAGSNISLSSSTAPSPTFTAPDLSASATLVFSLIVTDAGSEASETADSVSITVTAAPTAEAGDAQTVAEGVSVTLDGSASSDPEGEALTYAWTQTAPTVAQGADIALSGANTAAPTFTAPGNLLDEATLVFSLTVTDASGLASTPATVTITVTAVNDAPTANAGPDRAVAEGNPVTLDGSASSDPENQTLTYVWEQTSGTAVTLSSSTAAAPTFTGPNNLTANATLVFSLIVTDARGLVSTADTVTITVSLPAPDDGSGSDGSTQGVLVLTPEASDFGEDFAEEGLTLLLGETREITISGGIPPYTAVPPVPSSDDSIAVSEVVAVVDGTMLSITGAKVGMMTTLIIQDLGASSVPLKVEVYAPPLLNTGSDDGVVFRGGVKLSSTDDGIYFKDAPFSVNNEVDIIFVITPRDSDVDKQVDIVIAGRMGAAGNIMLLNEAGLLVPYDGATLISYQQDVELKANNPVYVTPKPFTLMPDHVGNWEVFIGYLLANDDLCHPPPNSNLCYHMEPLKIEVTR